MTNADSQRGLGPLTWLALFVLTLAVYWPALHGQFLWDDDGHVTRPALRSASGLGQIWLERGATQQYYPVLHSAFWVQAQLWGDAPFGYHVVNVLLHATAAGLLALLLRRAGVPGAVCAALLFAVHPVGVESVAWISEQKNTLSLVFYLAAALAYLRFCDTGRIGRYAAAAAWFLLALGTKTVTATLPAALLVVLWWRRGRLELRRDVVPLLPWFAAGIAAGLLTAHFEATQIGAEGAGFELSLVQRSLLAGRAVWFYAGKLLWPANLSFVYPRWTIDPGDAGLWIFAVGAVAVLVALAWLARRSRGPLAAVLIFGGSLFPALGFFNVYPFLFSYVADHFQYLASIAVFAAAGVGLTRLAGPFPRSAPWGLRAAMLLALGLMTWRQAGIYRDNETLFRATLARNPGAWMAHTNLGTLLVEAGRAGEAVPHFEAALRLRTNYAEGENNLGDCLRQLGRIDEARIHLERALQLRPRYAAAHNNLGAVLMGQNRPDEALRHFAAAIDARPDFPEAELNWAIALGSGQRVDEAVPHFERALQLRPNFPAAELMYGHALAQARLFPAAEERLRRALALDPRSGAAHAELALVLRQLGRASEAEQHLAEARRLGRTR